MEPVGPRNALQLDVFRMVMNPKYAAFESVRRDVARNLKAWQDWERDGYAAAFSKAWEEGHREKDDLCSLTIRYATSSKVASTLSCKENR